MASISGTINHAVTLGTTGAYASPLTITATGSISNNGTGDAIYGPGTGAWIVDNEGSVTASGSYDGISLKNGGTLTNGSSNATSLIAGGTGSVGRNGGLGVSLAGGGDLINAGTIAGGPGGAAYVGYSSSAPAGNGGVGINLLDNAIIANTGRISGGQGELADTAPLDSSPPHPGKAGTGSVCWPAGA